MKYEVESAPVDERVPVAFTEGDLLFLPHQEGNCFVNPIGRVIKNGSGSIEDIWRWHKDKGTPIYAGDKLTISF